MADDGAILTVRVTPRAGRDQISGWVGDALQVRVAAPPLDGRANAAVAGLVADALGIAHGRVSVAAGQRSRIKRLRIAGMTVDEVRRGLGG
jgi:uncharacterized protein (TIGR00251 family)